MAVHFMVHSVHLQILNLIYFISFFPTARRLIWLIEFAFKRLSPAGYSYE